MLEELGALARRMDPSLVSVVVVGSLARGEADAASDVDVVLVRRAGVGEDDESWVASAEAWRGAVRRLTGNPVQVLEADEMEVARRLRRPTSLWSDVIRDGITVYGSALAAIGDRRRA